MLDNTLFAIMEDRLADAPKNLVRYLYDEIDWSLQMIGISGPRGVGKTTLMLQHILNCRKETENSRKHLYVSADNIYFSTHSLIELADEFVKEGGTHLYIDEVHKYYGWSQELKNIYDTHRRLNVIVSGSSVLDLSKGSVDLSRRLVMYNLQGLSFREYLYLYEGVEVPVYSLEEIVNGKATLPGIEHPLPLFRDYLRRGYYPFSLEGRFERKMLQIISQTFDVDIPAAVDMKISTARRLKKMLSVIAGLAPFKPNALSLANEVGVSKNNVPEYLVWMELAQMIGQLRDDTGGLRGVGKVEKIYIDNPNLMYVLASGNPETGNIRETFFYNQTRVKNDPVSSRESDFCIGRYTFEIGGRKKGKKQIEDIANGIVVKDDIEYASPGVVPLWAFGLNY